jgi:predicted nucleic acid-binding protein
MLMPLFKGVPQMVEQARRHRDLYGHLNITIITYYEVMKGHEYVGARDRQKVFDEFCRLNNVIQNVKHFQRITGLKVENWLS